MQYTLVVVSAIYFVLFNTRLYSDSYHIQVIDVRSYAKDPGTLTSVKQLPLIVASSTYHWYTTNLPLITSILIICGHPYLSHTSVSNQ